MNQLIKITEQDGSQVVSARELHAALNATERFQNWFNRQLQYGFEENKDFVGCKTFNTLANQHLQDYALTTDTAKEISMLQRTEQGRSIRKYLIDFEKSNRQPAVVKELSRKEIALMLVESEERNEILEAENARLKPRSEFVDLVFESESLFTISEASKLLQLNYGRNTLFSLLKKHGMLFIHKNEPKQELIDRGYFKVKAREYDAGPKGIKISTQTLVTQKGIAYIAKKLNIIITQN